MPAKTLSIGKALGLGVLVAVILTAIVLPLVLLKVAPIEQPFAVTFVQTVFGESTPMPVGLAFHFVYATFWATLFARFWAADPVRNAISLSGILWFIQLIVFMPIVGWGFLGLGVGTATVLPTLIPHVLFAVILATTGVLVKKKCNC